MPYGYDVTPTCTFQVFLVSVSAAKQVGIASPSVQSSVLYAADRSACGVPVSSQVSTKLCPDGLALRFSGVLHGEVCSTRLGREWILKNHRIGAQRHSVHPARRSVWKSSLALFARAWLHHLPTVRYANAILCYSRSQDAICALLMQAQGHYDTILKRCPVLVQPGLRSSDTVLSHPAP